MNPLRSRLVSQAWIAFAAFAYAAGSPGPAVATAAEFPGGEPAWGAVALPGPTAGEVPAIQGRVDPETYRVGPGDEIAFRYSDLVDPKVLRIGPTGDLLLPDAGSIAAAGLTLNELERRVRDLLRPFVRGKGLALTLHRPRRFRAFVLGEVERPGPVLVQAPARASDAIAAAGGVAGTGSRRGIRVRRGSDSLTVDLVRFERAGDLDANPLVFETDIVLVPPAGSRVIVLGAVPHPGAYDFVPGDRVSALVALSGGALPWAALSAAELSRTPAAGRSESVPLRLADAIGTPGGPGDPLLQDGDRLFLPEQSHWREGAHVYVLGEVQRPGPYPIVAGSDRVRTLIDRAGGTTELADPTAVRVERETDEAVRDSAFMRLAREQDALLPASERDYLLTMVRARHALSVPVGALLAQGDARADVPLRDGDRIVVPRRSMTVAVQGEVKMPGLVPFVEGGDVGSFVRAAGGYTDRANRGRVRVTLAATGRQVGASEAGTLHDGDTVWVPAREPRSTWGMLRDVLTTAAQVATVYLVVHEATK